MNIDYSASAFFIFLEYAAEKGLVKPATVLNWKNAALRLFEILDDNQLNDLTQVDIDELFQRFANLEGSKFKPSSLKIYRSRLNSAIEEFTNYKQDPMKYKPGVTKRARSNAKKTNKKNDQPEPQDTKHHTLPSGETKNTHPAIVGLLNDLPTPGNKWSTREKELFIQAFKSTLDFIYPDKGDPK